MGPHDLTGEARELYESWRRLGHTEEQALDEVRRSGIVFQQEMEDMFLRVGLTESQARAAARGRNGGVPPADPFEQMYEAFQATGMSESQARAAAIGRHGTEYQARQWWADSMRESAPGASGSLQESAGRGGRINIREVGQAPDAELQETFRGIAAKAREIQDQMAGRPGAEGVIADATAIETVAKDLERRASR